MAQATSTVAENKALVRRFVEEVQARGDVDAIDELLAPDLINHTPPPGLPADREGARLITGAIRSAFPDHDAVIEQMVGEGDLVATYKTFTGTHSGEFMGIPPTGRRVTIRVMDFVRIRDGKVVDHWNIVDVAGLMGQLGVMGGPAG